MLRLTPVAPQPAGHVLKPLEHVAVGAKGTVLNRASYGLLRRTNHHPPAPVHSNVRIMVHRPCPAAARTKASDDEAEPAEPEAPAPKQGEEAAAAGPNRGPQRSMACQFFESVYVCAYVFSWRTGELIFWNVDDALKRLRRYVLEKFNRKR